MVKKVLRVLIHFPKVVFVNANPGKSPAGMVCLPESPAGCPHERTGHLIFDEEANYYTLIRQDLCVFLDDCRLSRKNE